MFVGAWAEVLSVLIEQTPLLEQTSLLPQELAVALDPSIPDEERIAEVAKVRRKISRSTISTRWLPEFSDLSSLEYSNQFYPGYRDHTIHSLSVYLLGSYIFFNSRSLRKSLISHLRSVGDESMPDSQLFFEWWTITALWHDCGYPFEASSFTSDTSLSLRIFNEIDEKAFREPFSTAISIATNNTIPLREVYESAGYSPHRLNNIDAIITPDTVNIVDSMFWRLGARREASAVREIAELTLKKSKNRPPYYDHGVMGALLLSTVWREVERFTLRKTSATANDTQSNATKIALLETLSSQAIVIDGLVRAAIEAIAFHNLSLRDWEAPDTSALLADGTGLAMPSLSSEPHLMYLGLVDTLQDWDRHHYVPGMGIYRPATRSSEMLIQATDDKIKIAISKEKKKGASEIERLFTNWIDVRNIFDDSPSFSIPDRIDAVGSETIAEQNHSEIATEKLKNHLANVAIEVTPLLATQGSDLSESCATLESSLALVKEKSVTIGSRSLSTLYGTREWRNFRQLQKVVGGLVTVGSRIQRGTINQKLGEGGFGVVYAIDDGHRTFAYKMFHPSELDNEEKIRRFRRGYEAMQKIGNYAGVVQVYEYTEYPIGFCMKMINGMNVHECHKDMGDVHRRIVVLEQVAETVAYAHSRNVLHRDVKPGNVIIDRETQKPVLTDFDLAWISGRSTIAGQVYASMIYGAPEQFEEKLSSYREQPTVDVYSFGALAFFVLTGQEPSPFYNNETRRLRDTIERAMQGRLGATAIDNMWRIIEKCLSPRPDDRFPTMNAVIDRMRKMRLGALSPGDKLRAAAFLREIQVSSGLLFHNDEAHSMSGRIKVTVTVQEEDDMSIVTLKWDLMGLPSYNVVSHEKFRDTVAKKLKNCADKIRVAKRTNVSITGNTWELRLTEVQRTAGSAGAVGGLVRDGIGCVE